MPEKTLSTHILNKHDVDTNWEDSSYIAKSGELIVYDVDSNNTSPRLKIGDGNTVTSDLPFIAAGSIYSGTLPAGTDLNTLYGNQHWGKIYWLIDTHNISNTPNSVTSGSVEIIRAGYSSTIQIFRTSTASSSSSRPTSYQRRIDDLNTSDAITNWEEIVTADGSYSNLGAGHLQEIQINTRSSDAVGWYKCGEFDVSRNTGSGDLSCSVILQVNGTNYSNYSQNAISAAPSGQIEVDTRIVGGVYNLAYSAVLVISGDITSNDFCIDTSDNGEKLNLYVNISHRYRDFKITKISEGQENVPSPNIFEFTDEYYGTTAPANAVYAVVRNIASYLIDDAVLNNTTVGDIGYNTDVANRTKLVTVNSIAYWNGAYQDTTSNLTHARTPSTNSDTNEIATTAWVRDVVPGIKVNNAGSADTAVRLTTGRTVRVNLASSSAVAFNGTANITPGVTGILPVANGGTGASSLSSITVGNANQLGGVVASKYAKLASPAFTGTPTAPTPSTSDDSTKIATTAWVHNQNYLTTIPSASQTTLGGVKVYTDSGGYLCIDTE